ncbi:hypothetical protein HZ326_25114 [Fusarium oxysporum f. sp. albedinis]|nr:hypothetical protein HZ326_25114 [Fusarium oxysporum f. sp. albedinis]
MSEPVASHTIGRGFEWTGCSTRPRFESPKSTCCIETLSDGSNKIRCNLQVQHTYSLVPSSLSEIKEQREASSVTFMSYANVQFACLFGQNPVPIRIKCLPDLYSDKRSPSKSSCNTSQLVEST